MKGLKNLAIFLAGGFTVLWILHEGSEMNVKHPREGSIIFENDEIRVIRNASEPGKGSWCSATVLYKNKN